MLFWLLSDCSDKAAWQGRGTTRPHRLVLRPFVVSLCPGIPHHAWHPLADARGYWFGLDSFVTFCGRTWGAQVSRSSGDKVLGDKFVRVEFSSAKSLQLSDAWARHLDDVCEGLRQHQAALEAVVGI